MPLVRADVIVEWGVAVKRALPWPSTVNDVVWGAWYETSAARRLPRAAFEPQPSVDAGVLVFERRADPLVPARSAGSYRRFVAAGFRRGLRSVVPPPHAAGAAARIRPASRARCPPVGGAVQPISTVRLAGEPELVTVNGRSPESPITQVSTPSKSPVFAIS